MAGEPSQTGAKRPDSNIVDAREIKLSACFGYLCGGGRREQLPPLRALPVHAADRLPLSVAAPAVQSGAGDTRSAAAE